MGLSYPFGVAPGFDPSHLAANGVLFSGVCTNSFIDVRSSLAGTKVGAPVFGVNGTIGPYLNFLNASSADGVTFTGDTSDQISVTMACIIRPNSIGASADLFHNGDALADGVSLNISATGTLRLAALGGVVPVSSFTLSANVPYFLAASNAGAANVCVFVGVNLGTGQYMSSTTTGFVTDLPPTGTLFTVGNRGSLNTVPALAKMSAVMYSKTFNPLPVLLQWAADPWSFWYPNKDT